MASARRNASSACSGPKSKTFIHPELKIAGPPETAGCRNKRREGNRRWSGRHSLPQFLYRSFQVPALSP